ncbi:hypothetical protein AMJ83_01805 [candidate division WOR_3 bacterium SM23_42]|uniref:Cyclic nucleotide-binding protein n=1 Tax=candidate division WOR_3 bacterium SM23_42 TaxID=1703779 RepID=A0A0S8FUV3_UNCW3|nr:MAG: hypothetical protein AMJ83_01805 [candidate division WOR_3 bacterium SM23_42]
MMKQPKDFVCQICGKPKKRSEVIPAELVRAPLVALIKKTHPDWSSEGFICISDLNRFRSQYVQEVLETEKGELSALEKKVMESIREEELLSKNVNTEFEQKLTLNERMADRLAEYAGSWRFITGFFAVLVVWILLNSFLLIFRPFDPYPFILLNLVLSCLAAIQAPIIMMSQNRQEAKDRLRSEHDYVVNLKAELEIRHLHEKIDHLLMNQWQRLLEIQEIQMELMGELTRKQGH